MDPGTLAAIVALAVAFMALIISLAQVVLQYIVTGQLIRICDSVVYGKMPGQGRRVWDISQFRFRVVYSIPQISLDSSLWPGASLQQSLPAVNSTLPDLRLARASPTDRPRQDAKRLFNFPGRETRPTISGEASWVSFVRTIQHSSGKSLKYELIEGDADRCPVDLPVVPMQLSMRDIIAGAIRAGMECIDVSFPQQTLSMQGAAGTITSSRHPVLGALLHFAPKRPGEEHGLRTKNGVVDSHWMKRMWDVATVAGCEYNSRNRKHFEEDEGPWIRTSSDRSLVKLRGHGLNQFPEERNTLRQRRPLGITLTAHQPHSRKSNEDLLPNVMPTRLEPDLGHKPSEMAIHRPQDGEWSYASKYLRSTTKPFVQDNIYFPSASPLIQSSSRLGWFHGLVSTIRNYLANIARQSDTAISSNILPITQYGNASSHDKVELENGLGNLQDQERISTNRTTVSSNRLSTENLATVTPQYHHLHAHKDRNNQSQMLNAPSTDPHQYMINGSNLNENETSSQAAARDLSRDHEQKLARARTEQVLKKWQSLVEERREARERRSKEEQDTRQRGLSDAPSEGLNSEQKLRSTRGIGYRSRSGRSFSNRWSSRDGQHNESRVESKERGRRVLRDKSTTEQPQPGRLQTRSWRSRHSPSSSSADDAQPLGQQVISSPSSSDLRLNRLDASMKGADASLNRKREKWAQELSKYRELARNSRRERYSQRSPTSMHWNPGPIYRSPSPINRSTSPLYRARSPANRSSRTTSRSYNPRYRRPSPVHRRGSPNYRSLSPCLRNISPIYINENELSPDSNLDQVDRWASRRGSIELSYEKHKDESAVPVEYRQIPISSNGGHSVHMRTRSKRTSSATSGPNFELDKQEFRNATPITLKSPSSVMTAEIINSAQERAPNELRKENRSDREGIPHNAQWTRISSRLVSPEALEQCNEPFRWERFEEASGFLIVLRVLSRDEIEAYADLTGVLRGTQTAPQNVSFESPSESEDSEDSSASHHSFERVRPQAGAKGNNIVPEQSKMGFKNGDYESQNKVSRQITAGDEINPSTAKVEFSEPQPEVEEMSSENDTSKDNEPGPQLTVSKQQYQTWTPSTLQDRRHSVASEQIVSDDEHVLLLTSENVLKRADQRIKQCIDIEIALKVFWESYKNDGEFPSDAIDIREQIEILNTTLTEILARIKQHSYPPEIAKFAVYELDTLIWSLGKSLVVLESEFALFEIHTATPRWRRTIWARMLTDFQERNTCSLLEHLRINGSFASGLLADLQQDRLFSAASEQLKEQVTEMNRRPFSVNLASRERSSSRQDRQSSPPYPRQRTPSPPNDYITNSIAIHRPICKRRSDSSGTDMQSAIGSGSDKTKASKTNTLKLPQRPARRAPVYPARSYSPREYSPDSDTIFRQHWSERRRRRFPSGNVNWLWICQVDTIPGYFATPWKNLFSEPICTGAISVLLRGLDFYTNSSTKRTADRLPRYDDWIRTGNRTYPSYAINAKGGIVVSGTYDMVKFDAFDNCIPPIELLEWDSHQVQKSYAHELPTILANTAELMSLDCWLSFCGRLPEICNGPSNLLRNMPALVQRIMVDFEDELRIVDRTSSDGGFQIIQQIADNLKQALVEHNLSEPEQLFAIVALLRAAKTALCVIRGTDTTKLRDVLLHDVQVYLA